MKLFSRKRTKLSERARDIEREIAEINSEIRILTRHLDNQGEEIVRSGGHAPMLPRPSRMDRQAEMMRMPAQVPAAVRETTPDLFDTTLASREQRLSARSDVSSRLHDMQEASHRGHNAALAEDERFASYFMSGGLRSNAPLRQERQIQRNKAIVAIVLLVIVLIVVYATILR